MMLGHGAFGEFAFCGDELEGVDLSAFVDFLKAPAAARCWLLEIETATDTLYYSTHGFTSRSTDAPASQWYDGRLSGEIHVDRRIVSDSGLGGLTRVSATASLKNEDGGLDALLTAYSLDGRVAALYVGRPQDARSDFNLVYRGTVLQAVVALDRLDFAIEDGSAVFALPIQNTLYAGSGGLEGGDDLADQPKPLAWGASWNVSPPLVDAAKLIYQVHDGAINGVPAVYDRGVVLSQGSGYISEADMNATAPASGEYRIWQAGGYFRLGATPAGTVTCDVQGDAGGGYVVTTGDILRRVLVLIGLTSSEIDPISFDKLNIDAPAAVGIWVGAQSRSRGSVIEELLMGISAFGGFNRSGAFTAGVIAIASAIAGVDLTSEHIVDIVTEPLPAGLDPVVWRVTVGWKQNYTVQNDLAASVSDARRTFSALAQRQKSASDSAVRTAHRLARKHGPVRGLYGDSADASTEAARLLALWSGPPRMLRVTTRAAGLITDVGGVVSLTHARMGLSGGATALVLDHSFDALSGRAELKVLA